MNRIGGKSNTGEGGEDPERFKRRAERRQRELARSSRSPPAASASLPLTSPARRRSRSRWRRARSPVKAASCPATRSAGYIAQLRHTVPGVMLISPAAASRHLLHRGSRAAHPRPEGSEPARQGLREARREAGVGTVAAGVAKAHADIVLISGHDGGTGASPLSSIKHAGTPWELGVAETQQVLMVNNLRNRIVLRTDGGMRTGEDIVKAAILGAEEFNFGTAALIALGCVYVRQCHLNTCPVGIATQDEKLRGEVQGHARHAW